MATTGSNVGTLEKTEGKLSPELEQAAKNIGENAANEVSLAEHAARLDMEAKRPGRRYLTVSDMFADSVITAMFRTGFDSGAHPYRIVSGLPTDAKLVDAKVLVETPAMVQLFFESASWPAEVGESQSSLSIVSERYALPSQADRGEYEGKLQANADQLESADKKLTAMRKMIGQYLNDLRHLAAAHASEYAARRTKEVQVEIEAVEKL